MEAETWVAIAFVIFLGILAYVGVHRTILNALDKRSARIKTELDEARQLRDEAKALLAEYQNKKGEAQREADAIVAGAKADAERMAAEADAKLAGFRRPPHQDGGDQDRPGRGAGLGRCARRRRRGRGRRRRKGAGQDRDRQGRRCARRPRASRTFRKS